MLWWDDRAWMERPSCRFLAAACEKWGCDGMGQDGVDGIDGTGMAWGHGMRCMLHASRIGAHTHYAYKATIYGREPRAQKEASASSCLVLGSMIQQPHLYDRSSMC